MKEFQFQIQKRYKGFETRCENVNQTIKKERCRLPPNLPEGIKKILKELKNQLAQFLRQTSYLRKDSLQTLIRKEIKNAALSSDNIKYKSLLGKHEYSGTVSQQPADPSKTIDKDELFNRYYNRLAILKSKALDLCKLIKMIAEARLDEDESLQLAALLNAFKRNGILELKTVTELLNKKVYVSVHQLNCGKESDWKDRITFKGPIITKNEVNEEWCKDRCIMGLRMKLGIQQGITYQLIGESFSTKIHIDPSEVPPVKDKIDTKNDFGFLSRVLHYCSIWKGPIFENTISIVGDPEMITAFNRSIKLWASDNVFVHNRLAGTYLIDQYM